MTKGEELDMGDRIDHHVEIITVRSVIASKAVSSLVLTSQPYQHVGPQTVWMSP
jgi:hypothetical protein